MNELIKYVPKCIAELILEYVNNVYISKNLHNVFYYDNFIYNFINKNRLHMFNSVNENPTHIYLNSINGNKTKTLSNLTKNICYIYNNEKIIMTIHPNKSVKLIL